ncbi:hypothetical protein ABH011_24635, partial [Bacteroides thetaiotaomicron]|uniref:hypothetical protein n=1 Tax=Bacteroides thetaiotaomicron TaxID=818 RepID=UPI0032601912
YKHSLSPRFLPGAEPPPHRCRREASSVPDHKFIGAGRFQAAKIGKSKKKEGRIYIIYRFSLPIIDSLYER